MSQLYTYIQSCQITIFSKTTCSYCTKAKQLLNNQYNVNVQIVELDQMVEGVNIANELKIQTNQTTVPNIFLFGNHIGGYTDLKNLHDSGTLSTLFQQKTNPYTCGFCGKSSPSKNLTCKCFSTSFADWGSMW